MTTQKNARRGALMGNVAMVVTLSFLLIAPWILGELYREPAKTKGAAQNQYPPAAR
jgi:hypothetical protein